MRKLTLHCPDYVWCVDRVTSQELKSVTLHEQYIHFKNNHIVPTSVCVLELLVANYIANGS